MSVQSLRSAIAFRARELRIPALLAAGMVAHKRHWQTCECSWCAKKREATASIANMAHIPAYRFRRGHLVEDMREAYRDELRCDFRQQLRALEKE